MSPEQFLQTILPFVPEIEKLIEYAVGALENPDTSDPAVEHQLALNMIRKVQDAQAKKDIEGV